MRRLKYESRQKRSKQEMGVLPRIIPKQDRPLEFSDAQVPCEPVHRASHDFERRKGPHQEEPRNENGPAESQYARPAEFPKIKNKLIENGGRVGAQRRVWRNRQIPEIPMSRPRQQADYY